MCMCMQWQILKKKGVSLSGSNIRRCVGVDTAAYMFRHPEGNGWLERTVQDKRNEAERKRQVSWRRGREEQGRDQDEGIRY